MDRRSRQGMDLQTQASRGKRKRRGGARLRPVLLVPGTGVFSPVAIEYRQERDGAPQGKQAVLVPLLY
jgi:hypothetical protein